ncbi:hypothetical protein [Shigella phage ESh16]|nr:hypothetical protein [Shigella phage ESh16]
MKTEKQMFLMKLIEEYANAVSDYEYSARERGTAFAKEEMKLWLMLTQSFRILLKTSFNGLQVGKVMI